MSFLRNCWYGAAWSDELAPGAVLPRTIADTPLVLWRQLDGEVSALLDRCPHRLAPLSLGHCDGSSLRCSYHGLRFDGGGRCVENPHGPLVSGLDVQVFALVERHGLLWVWLGDIKRADPGKIPALEFIDRARTHAISKGYMRGAAGHRLFVDNILDLSHADYLHPDTLGGGSITRSKAKVEQRGDTIFVQWLTHDEIALPILRPEMPHPDMLTDMWTEVHWHPSGVMLLEAGATPVGSPRDAGIYTENVHIMTPESKRSTHYFYCNARNYRTKDARYNADFAAGLRSAFENEDKPMIEAQQRALGDSDLFEHKPALLAIDNASTQARRIFDRLVATESAQTSI